MSAFVRSALQDGVTTLTLDRAEALHALSPPLMVELAQALRVAGSDERTRAIVLTGAGRAFSAGGDIGWYGEVLAGGDAASAQSLEQQLADERTAQRRHVAGPFFNDACARLLARASH